MYMTGHIKIHAKFMHDTCEIHRIRILITNVPKFDNKCTVTRVGKEWTTVEPDSEIKLVRVSGGTSRACFFMRNQGFGLVCELESGISTCGSILKVLKLQRSS